MSVVFDFDKTLTNDDSLFGFYKEVHGTGFRFMLKRFLLLVTVGFYKLKLLNNDRLKKVGIHLFLKGKTKKEIEQAAQSYGKSIRLNRFYTDYFLGTDKSERIIITASFEEYIKPLFPDEKIVGSKLSYQNNMVVGLERNMYGLAKAKCTQANGISSILILYTDSYSDKPLMEISKEVYLIRGQLKNKIK